MIDGITPPKTPQKPEPSFKIPPRSTPADEPTIAEPSFVPPEMVAEQPDPVRDTIAGPSWQRANVRPGGKKGWFSRFSKKQRILFASIGTVLVIGSGLTGFLLTRKQPAPAPQQAPVVQQTPAPAPPAPTTVASRLTGIQVAPELDKLPVTGVMIENSPDARPQSGLKDAGVVFEAIAEGGITRFLALFQESKPDYVGPVRSVRPYYLSWLQGFDAPIAHVGGSAEALQIIKTTGIKDLDQFYNTGPYRRVSNRYAPHNMYTDLNKLIDLEKSKGWTSSTFNGFTRKDKEAPAPTPTAKSIDIVISGYLYNVHYDYDAATNTYKRVLAGKPHNDERSGTQLSPKVAIAMVVPYSLASDRLHSVYQTIGSGKAFIFQDGVVTEGIWEKQDAKSQIKFGDANGKAISLNPGQTWITAVGAASNVSYKP